MQVTDILNSINQDDAYGISRTTVCAPETVGKLYNCMVAYVVHICLKTINCKMNKPYPVLFV